MTRRYISGLLTFAATIFAVGQALALETLPGEPEFDRMVEAAHEQAVPSDEPLATGRVVAVDRAAGRITLEFRPIPQLLLEGGTRIFLVKDPASLKSLGPGDKVRFEVERDGRSFVVTRVVNSN
ncbi:MAG TPA: copper-binding protein [Reyranella sp.]|jgi:Cu/Ag efflux protein CusF|nr:copper-binding protein [Reyranella sp.]